MRRVDLRKVDDAIAVERGKVRRFARFIHEPLQQRRNLLGEHTLRAGTRAAKKLREPKAQAICFVILNDLFLLHQRLEQPVHGCTRQIERLRNLTDAAEPGGATAFAALTSGAYVRSPGEKIAVVICGGNADPASFA